VFIIGLYFIIFELCFIILGLGFNIGFCVVLILKYLLCVDDMLLYDYEY